MFTKTKFAVLTLGLVAALAPASRADGFGFSFTKGSKHGAFTLGYSSGPAWAPSYRVRPRPARWVPGHYETVRERVWIPASFRKVWVEPAYEWRRDACGRAYRSCVASGHYEMVKQVGRYEYRDVQVWVEGFWRT